MITLAELQRDDLPPTLPFVDAARAIGMGRSAAYNAKHEGRFHLPVIELGPGRWVVPTAALLRFLGVEPTLSAYEDGAGPPADAVNIEERQLNDARHRD